MFPPGRVMFFRPIKLLERSEKEEGVKQQWDCIWVTPQELIQEGILVSKKVRMTLLARRAYKIEQGHQAATSLCAQHRSRSMHRRLSKQYKGTADPVHIPGKGRRKE